MYTVKLLFSDAFYENTQPSNLILYVMFRITIFMVGTRIRRFYNIPANTCNNSRPPYRCKIILPPGKVRY